MNQLRKGYMQLSKIGYGLSDMLKGTSLYHVGTNTMLLKGDVGLSDIMHLKNWIMTLKIDAVQDAVLILDSAGGATDPSIIKEMMQIPIHCHVAGKAESFAALLLLAGSSKTLSPDAYIMLHTARWGETKEAESVALDEEVLFRHRYKTASFVSTVAPGRAKKLMVDAVTGKEDVYFSDKYLFDVGAVDGVVDYTGEALGLADTTAIWYNATYGQQEES